MNLRPDEKFAPRVQGGKIYPNQRALLDGSFYVHHNRDVEDVYLNFAGRLTKLNLGKYDTLEVDTIIAKNLYANRFTIRQTTFQNGDLMISDGGIVEEVKGTEIAFKDQTGLNICAFVVGDLIEAHSVRADKTLAITNPQAQVTGVVGNKITVTYYGTSPFFQKGDEVYRVGSATDATRRDSLYFSTNRTNTPYFAIYDGINSFDTSGSPTTAWTTATPIVLIGNGKSLDAGYTHGVYIGAGGQLIVSPSASVTGVVTHAPVYTSGDTFPVSPAATDWHFYTKTPPDAPYITNTWYKYSGSAWENQGLKGTYIDGNGIYTGTVVAAQVIAGTLTGFTIQTSATGQRVVISSANVITFYDSEGNTTTLYGGTTVGGPARVQVGGQLNASGTIFQNGSAVATQSWTNGTFSGSIYITTLGTISTGVWNGTAIDDSKISSAATWNALVSFPGFGTSHSTAAYGDHNHSGVYSDSSHTHSLGSLDPGSPALTRSTISYKDHAGANQTMNVVTY